MSRNIIWFLVVNVILNVFISLAHAQSSPGWPYGYVPTAGQWNAAFASKQNVLGFTPLNIAGGTMTGRLNLAPSNSSAAGFNIGVGVNPSGLLNGDLWLTTSGLFVRDGGVTYRIGLGASGGYTADLPLIGNGSGGISQGTRSGTTTVFGTLSGSTTTNNCVKWDASGNLVDSGGPCTLAFGTGSDSPILLSSTNTGFQNQLFVNNQGTVANASTSVVVSASLGACATCSVVMRSDGGTNPVATVESGAGMTTGMNVVAGAGNLNVQSAAGNLNLSAPSGRVVSAQAIATAGYAIGSLPAGTIGDRAYITDQITACPANGITPTAGGALACPVFFNGAAWVGG